MTRYEKTKYIRWCLDFLITSAVMLLIALACPWWVIPLVLVYGWWNYYDGKTRSEYDGKNHFKLRRLSNATEKKMKEGKFHEQQNDHTD